jgi:hypothetical protein
VILPRRSPGRRDAAPLTRCRMCGADFVIPVDWHEHDAKRWWIRLRCGECGVLRDVVVPDAEAQRYNAQLDYGVGIIAGAFARLERERMTALADSFAHALQLDLLDAADFGCHGGARPS